MRACLPGFRHAFDQINKQMQAWADKYADEVSSRMRTEMRKKGHNEF